MFSALCLVSAAQEPRGTTTNESDVRVEVRFFPSFHPTSQLVITFTGKQAKVEYLKSQILLDKAVRKSATEDPVAIAKSIPLERRTALIDPDKARHWMDDLWPSLSQSPEVLRKTVGLLQLDGTKYEIRVSTSLAELSLTVLDEEIAGNEPNGQVPIVRWANAVKSEVENTVPLYLSPKQ